MKWPLVVLAIPSAFIGIAMAGLADFHPLPAFGAYIHAAVPHGEHAHTFIEAITNPVAIWSTVFGVSGLVLAFLFYVVAPAIPEAIKNAPFASAAFSLFSRKWYFDEMYQGFVDRIYLTFARGSSSFDKGGIDGLVNVTGRAVMSSGYSLRELQSGKVQTYIAVMFFSVVTLSLLLFYWLM
jgi:hypothetical protein